MHAHCVHCGIFDVEHWNITQRRNKVLILEIFPVKNVASITHNTNIKSSKPVNELARDRICEQGMFSDEPAQTHSLTRAITSRNDQVPIVGI